MMQSGYTPIAGIEVPLLMKEDLTFMAVAWLQMLATRPEGAEHQHARRVVIRLVRTFEASQLRQMIDATPQTPAWDGFVLALEADIERRQTPRVAWGPVVGQMIVGQEEEANL